MKIFLKVIGVIVVLIATLASGAGAYRADLDKSKLIESKAEFAQAESQLATLKENVKVMTGESKTEMDAQIAELEDMIAKIPSESTYGLLTALFAGLIVVSLAFGYFLFRPKMKPLTLFLAVASILFIAAYIVSPDIKTGPYGGAESRTLALVAGIPVMIAGLISLAVAKMKKQLTPISI